MEIIIGIAAGVVLAIIILAVVFHRHEWTVEEILRKEG